MAKLFFAHVFMKMIDASILMYLTLHKRFKKTCDSNTLSNLLKLYQRGKPHNKPL